MKRAAYRRCSGNRDLDHNDTRDCYLGISHATCNLRDEAKKTNALRPPDLYVERPYRWSRRFYDDPPIGTIVHGDERVIYVGNGDWQPLDVSTVEPAQS